VQIAPNVMISGEATQLRRMLSNLLDNSVRYVPDGCEVRLSLAAGPRLIVADTGPGIPAPVRARLFERFTAGAGGHGLGLALVRAIVHRHDWKIRVESDGNGTQIVIGPDL
jgi:signal transduction histidine kinase